MADFEEVVIAGVEVGVGETFLSINKLMFNAEQALEIRDFIDKHVETAPRFK